jgi:hypothetical protein
MYFVAVAKLSHFFHNFIALEFLVQAYIAFEHPHSHNDNNANAIDHKLS